jgi:hypothetical protein
MEFWITRWRIDFSNNTVVPNIVRHSLFQIKYNEFILREKLLVHITFVSMPSNKTFSDDGDAVH